ncbi:hypothetical protein FQN52_002600 [Onygenales sp. PD_12]|nr:hypothetical protein FQN52_002600 [Onygenales sp. PD_12]
MLSRCLRYFTRDEPSNRRSSSGGKEFPKPVERLITMASGKCTRTVTIGQMVLPCPCNYGMFDVSNAPDNFGLSCKRCEHPLAAHENAAHQENNNPPQAPVEPSQAFDAAIVEPAEQQLAIRTPRNRTVEALWDRLQRDAVVHVRGTPASGKSTLARLLRFHVQKVAPNLSILPITWPMASKFPTGFWDQTPYHQLLNLLSNRSLEIDDWKERRILIIIDEAQGSYPYTSLWNDFIKSITPHEGPLVALFSSYGSPTEAPLGDETPTPILFSVRQRISLRPTPANPEIGLFFSHEEFDDVVARVSRGHGEHGQAFLLSDDLKAYIYDLSSGHPAAVRSLLDGLAVSDKFRRFRKTSSEISLADARDYFADDNFLLDCFRNCQIHGFERGLPRKKHLQDNPSVVEFLRSMVIIRQTSDSPENDPALNICYRQGWLQAELSTEGNPVYGFATPLHRRYMENILAIDAPPFPTNRFPALMDLCSATVRNINPAALRTEEWGNPALGLRPLEAIYQDEFYRSCCTLLGNQLYLSSEWSGTKQGGRVDFRVRGMPWAIEILRDGCNIEEHLARFKPGGNYYPWLENEEIQDYVVLDFRSSQPQKIRNDGHLFQVVFNSDFTACQIYNSNLDPIGDAIALLG